jgi:tripartite-type tricarboxylate transporter receptor subunit TctC
LTAIRVADPENHRRIDMSRAYIIPSKSRVAIAASVLAAVTTASSAPGLAQDHAFPTHPITIVVPFPPGSSADLIPRLLAPLMSQSLGVPMIVDNRPGATGSIGAGYVAKSEPSGHTLLMAPVAVLAVNPWLYKDLPYDTERDFAPVINAVSTPNVWVANPEFPAKSMAELVALARARPGAISYASGGSGTSMHLCGEALKIATGASLVHVPYKGPAPALKDVLSGQVPVMCNNLSNVLTQIRSGRLRALAVTARTRDPLLPQVPTAAEAGFPEEFGAWFGFVAPAKTPKDVIERLNAEFAKALRAPAVAERLQGLGLTIVADSPEHFAKYIATELAAARKQVIAYGAKAD